MIIMSIPTQILIFVFSLSLYVALVSKILPLILLKAKYKVRDIGDRGLKKYVYEGGRAIVYKPFGEAGKYIKQYILSENNGEKYIKCKVDKRVTSIKYDVVAMNSKDKEIGIIEISVPMVHSGDVKAAILPEDTAYVCVVVKEVNKIVVPDSPKMCYSVWRVAAMVGAVAVLTVIEFLLLRSISFSFVKAILPSANAVAGDLPMMQMILSAILGAALAWMIFIFHSSKDTKISK